jgi:hypothetical protein
MRSELGKKSLVLGEQIVLGVLYSFLPLGGWQRGLHTRPRTGRQVSEQRGAAGCRWPLSGRGRPRTGLDGGGAASRWSLLESALEVGGGWIMDGALDLDQGAWAAGVGQRRELMGLFSPLLGQI